MIINIAILYHVIVMVDNTGGVWDFCLIRSSTVVDLTRSPLGPDDVDGEHPKENYASGDLQKDAGKTFGVPPLDILTTGPKVSSDVHLVCKDAQGGLRRNYGPLYVFQKELGVASNVHIEVIQKPATREGVMWDFALEGLDENMTPSFLCFPFERHCISPQWDALTTEGRRVWKASNIRLPFIRYPGSNINNVKSTQCAVITVVGDTKCVRGTGALWSPNLEYRGGFTRE